MYKLEDLEKAIQNRRQWLEAFGNDSSNNPNKYQAQIRDADIEVRKIERYLKDKGIIKKSESEILDDELDSIYPNAESKKIVNYKGKRYQIKYFPVIKSRSRKTVKEWGHTWVEL